MPAPLDGPAAPTTIVALLNQELVEGLRARRGHAACIALGLNCPRNQAVLSDLSAHPERLWTSKYLAAPRRDLTPAEITYLEALAVAESAVAEHEEAEDLRSLTEFVVAEPGRSRRLYALAAHSDLAKRTRARLTVALNNADALSLGDWCNLITKLSAHCYIDLGPLRHGAGAWLCGNNTRAMWRAVVAELDHRLDDRGDRGSRVTDWSQRLPVFRRAEYDYRAHK